MRTREPCTVRKITNRVCLPKFEHHSFTEVLNMAIDIKAETLVPLSEVGEWYAKHTGYRPNRSTVHRWRTRGARGVKLETVLIGGKRFTSESKLQAFNVATTEAADGIETPRIQARPTVASNQAEAFLAAEGI